MELISSFIIPSRIRSLGDRSEKRFAHVRELLRFGAEVHVDSRRAIIHGTKSLVGSSATGTDLRAGACLVAAGLGSRCERPDYNEYGLAA